MPEGQKLCRAETHLLQLAAEPMNTHTVCGSAKEERGRDRTGTISHMPCRGERSSYKVQGRGGSQPHTETRTARQKMDGDVPLPFELKGCRHRAPRKGL